ncbi:MAG: hypothetical protein HY076_05745, partial [Candidatus Eisenbacteria bacterium]|nr:hypothetical protein [Candidatus Eisenbacteria bacterium]
RREAAYAIEGVAALAGAQRVPEIAAGMLGAAEALRSAIGSPLLAPERAERAVLMDQLTRAAGAEAVSQWMMAGRRKPFEAVVTRALGWLEGDAGRTPGGPEIGFNSGKRRENA